MAKAIFISRQDLVNKTSLGGNVDHDKIMQYIDIAQETHILSYLGTDLYDKISQDITSSSLTGNYETLVNTYIKPMLIHYAMADALPFLAITVANGGIFKHSSENSQTVSEDEVNRLVHREEELAKVYTERYLRFMSNNASTMFPEYYTNSGADIHPYKNENYTRWVL